MKIKKNVSIFIILFSFILSLGKILLTIYRVKNGTIFYIKDNFFIFIFLPILLSPISFYFSDYTKHKNLLQSLSLFLMPLPFITWQIIMLLID